MPPADPLPLLPLAAAALSQLVALALLALAAIGAGWPLVRLLPVAGRREAVAVAAAAGLGVLGSVLFLLGLAGGLWRWVVLALAAVAAGAGAAALRAIRRSADGGVGPLAIEPALPPAGATAAGAAAPAFDPRPRAAAAALAVALVPAFVWGLFPPTGFDATTYHLPFARAFVEAHRLVVVPELVFPVFPQLAEVLFAGMMLATRADVAAHVVQLLALAAGALLLDAAGRRFFSPAAGLWAAALWLAHPLAHYQAASAYVDLVLALFGLLAVVAWEAWREGRAAGAERSGGWLVLAGAAGGFAAATKYLGLLWLGALGLVGLAGRPWRRRLAAAAVVGLVALAVGGPWYLRIHHHTGNPVHPMLGSLLGGGDAGSLYDRALGVSDAPSAGEGVAQLAGGAVRALARPAELPRFAWRASFDRRGFSNQSPLAPWHLVLVPLAAAFSWHDRRLLRWLLLVAVYALLWTTHDPRFQLPSMALLALAGGGALHHLGGRLPAVGRRLGRPAAAWAVAALLALPGPAYAVYKLVRHGPLPPVTPAARQAYLDREVAGHAAIRLLNRRHGGDYTVFVLHGAYLADFAHGRLLGHHLGPWREARVLPLAGDPAALHRELRTMEVDHLLAIHARGTVPFRRDAEFRRLFAPVAAADGWELLAVRGVPPPPAAPPPGAAR